ncbi:hypothetical protein BH23ACT12_BH23ACT12_01120 [soil metagenome]
MAFEVRSPAATRGDCSPSSLVRAERRPPEATSFNEGDQATEATLRDAGEVIRAHYRATAELVVAVYLD